MTTPLLGVVGHLRLGFDTVYVHAKVDDSSFSRSRDIIGDVKIQSGSRDPDHAPLNHGLPFLCWDLT